MKRCATTSQAGLYSFIAEGRERTGAYRQVGGMPLYMNVSMPVDAYWTPWYVQTRLYGAFALIALLALLALTALASEQFHEQAANAALLERQVSVRTKELRTETAALEILNRTGSALAAELDLDRIIENVVDAGIELTGAQFGAFFCGLSQDGKEHYAHIRRQRIRRGLRRPERPGDLRAGLQGRRDGAPRQYRGRAGS